MDKRAGAFEAHTGIDVLGREVAEAAVGLGVVLDKDQVPDLDTEIGIHIDQFALTVAVRREVHMEFGAGPAGAGLAHHPEVVFHVAVDDVNFRVEPFLLEKCDP